MTTDELVPALQIAHALFGSALFLALVIQGRLGWRIRSRRIAGAPQDSSAVKRHRALGPILASLPLAVFLAGLITVRIHKGLWVIFPGHLAVGGVVLALAAATALASREIRGDGSPWRARHRALGALLLCVFLVQVALGLGILL